MSQTHNLGYQPAVDTESQSREASVAKEGVHIHRTQTPGGHIANDDLIAIGASHRKIGNPLPLGAMAFGTTTLILSLYNVGAAGVTMPNAIVIYALFYGGLVQYCAGLWEYASGNTLGATIFCIYGFFWFGFSFIFIPFFGITGTYDGIPGVYTEAGGFASELNSAIGLFLWCWFGITSCLLIASARASITLVVLLALLDLTFGLLGGFYYYEHSSLQTAGGVTGILTAVAAFYLSSASLLTPTTSYFTLPVGSLAVKD